MRIRYEASFEKDLKRTKEKQILTRVKQTIEAIKKADSLDDLSNIKKMKGYDTYYRIRLGDYRVGIEVINDEVIMVRLLHRKDMYKYFP